MTRASLMLEAGHSMLVSGTTQGTGWGAMWVQDGGTDVHPWLTHVDVWQKPPHYCKIIILQLK